MAICLLDGKVIFCFWKQSVHIIWVTDRVLVWVNNFIFHFRVVFFHLKWRICRISTGSFKWFHWNYFNHKWTLSFNRPPVDLLINLILHDLTKSSILCVFFLNASLMLKSLVLFSQKNKKIKFFKILKQIGKQFLGKMNKFQQSNEFSRNPWISSALCKINAKFHCTDDFNSWPMSQFLLKIWIMRLCT